jgi:hypothetical protein
MMDVGRITVQFQGRQKEKAHISKIKMGVTVHMWTLSHRGGGLWSQSGPRKKGDPTFLNDLKPKGLTCGSNDSAYLSSTGPRFKSQYAKQKKEE